jgi:hypothetical protein
MIRNLRSKFSLENILPHTIYKKMQPNALLIWQQNIYDCKKSGVTNLPPLKESRPRDLGSARKQLGVICSKLFFMLPSCFILSMVTPLDFAHLDDLIVSHSLCGIQNLDWPLVVGQIPSKVKIFHRQLLFWNS